MNPDSEFGVPRINNDKFDMENTNRKYGEVDDRLSFVIVVWSLDTYKIHIRYNQGWEMPKSVCFFHVGRWFRELVLGNNWHLAY